MQDDLDFIKVQPSNGVIRDKQDRTIARVWIFRPDVATEDMHWFETPGDNNEFLCIETGPDKFPTNCKLAYTDSDGPAEWEALPAEDIMKMFMFCHKLLTKKHNELVDIGSDILEDMLPDKKDDGDTE